MINFTKKQKLSIVIGLALLLSNSFILYAIFLEAFFANNFIAIFEINKFGEAYVEFVFMPISIVLGLYVIKLIIKDLRSSKDETSKR